MVCVKYTIKKWNARLCKMKIGFFCITLILKFFQIEVSNWAGWQAKLNPKSMSLNVYKTPNTFSTSLCRILSSLVWKSNFFVQPSHSQPFLLHSPITNPTCFLNAISPPGLSLMRPFNSIRVIVIKINGTTVQRFLLHCCQNWNLLAARVYRRHGGTIMEKNESRHVSNFCPRQASRW